MKILHVIIGLEMGGAETSLLRLIETHKNSPDYNHSVISLTNIGKIGRLLQASGIRVDSLGLKSIFSILMVVRKLIKIIRDTNPDIIHTWMYHADLIGGIAAWFTKKKVIWSIRNTHVKVDSGTAKTTFHIMRICALLSPYIPNRIICVANAAVDSHVKYGYPLSKMYVIQNGYNVGNIYNLSRKNKQVTRESIGLDQDAIIIGTVGRYNDYKDYPTFIKAAEILLKLNHNLQFLLIGRNVNRENIRLTSLISNTNYTDSFFLLGERDDIPALLALMDIFCLHSVSEGFPNVLGEAMCVSVPCVTTDVGDAALMVGKDGVVVPHSQPELLAQGLYQIINLTHKDRKKSGDNLMRRIKANYSLAQVQLDYEMIYKEVTNE